jgi:hypothetical protein
MIRQILGLCIFVLSGALYGQGYDDPFTDSINEGAIGSGYDDPFTDGINEGSIGFGYRANGTSITVRN